MTLSHLQVGFIVISGCIACVIAIIRGMFFPPNPKKIKNETTT